jgi:hypothetical protein
MSPFAVPFAAVVSNSCSANKNCALLDSIAAALVVWQHRAVLFRLVYVSRAVLETGNDLTLPRFHVQQEVANFSCMEDRDAR